MSTADILAKHAKLIDENECQWCGSCGPVFLHPEVSTEMLEFWVCDGCLRMLEAHDRKPGVNQIQVDDTIYQPSGNWNKPLNRR